MKKISIFVFALLLLIGSKNIIAEDALNIDSSGNVGIGTNTPGYMLSLYGQAPEIEMKDSDTDKSWRVGTTNNNFSITETGVTDQFTITPGGKVGIGNTNPAALLDIWGEGNLLWLRNSTGNTKLLVSESGGLSLRDNIYFSNSGYKYFKHNGGTSSSDAFLFRFSDNEDVMIVRGDGNVGIGTSSIGYPLTVNGSAGVDNISIWSEGKVSASGYITRTSVWNKELNVWDYIHPASELKDKKTGKIKHNLMAPNHLNMNIDIKKGEKTEYYEEDNETKERTVPVYETKQVEGVLLDDLIAKHEQAIWELKQQNDLLAKRTALLEKALCEMGRKEFCGE